MASQKPSGKQAQSHGKDSGKGPAKAPGARPSKASKAASSRAKHGIHGQEQSLASAPAALPPPPPLAAAPTVPAVAPAAPFSREQPPYDGADETEQELPPTSRLCVKNLPKYTTEASLRRHFAAKGEVTDIKIMKTREGLSRQLGFVGFKTVDMAVAAHKYFDKTFMDATRIQVEFARKYQDPTLPRPWSKHSEGSSAHTRIAGPNPEVDGNQEEAEALAKKLKGRAADAAVTLDTVGPLGQRKSRSVISDMEAQDPKLAEFLALMAPRSRAQLWTNDELAPVQTLKDLMGSQPEAPLTGEEGKAGQGGEVASDDEEYQELGAVPGKPGSKRRTALTAVLGMSGGEEELAAEEPNSEGEQSQSDEGSEDEQAQPRDQAVVSEAVSDMDYLKSRMKKWNDDDDAEAKEDVEMADAVPSEGGVSGKNTEADEETEGDEAARGEQAAVSDDAGATLPPPPVHGKHGALAAVKAGVENGLLPPDPETAIRISSRLFIRNLAYTATEADLLQECGPHGDVTSVHLVTDRETKKSKGIAYVLFATPDEAVKAYRELDGQIFQGRLLHILPAFAPPSGVLGVEGPQGMQGDGEGGRTAGSSYKTELDAKRKENAGNRAAWNSLFMRPDTVQEAVAAHYGVTKAELMDVRASGDVAVRVALGEAAILQQTKAALLEQGVNVGSLEAGAAAAGRAAATRSVARSPNTLLVKNLPYSVTEEELRELFTRSGPVVRLVLPPSHTLALVEWAEAHDARSAFKALAYKKFHQVPLYLEWAPQDVFNTPAPAPPPVAAPKPPQASQPASQPAVKVDAPITPGRQPVTAAPEPVVAPVADIMGDDDEGDEGAGATIYVKNLAFATVDAGLKAHFDKVASALGGLLLSSRVAQRAHPSTGKLLSAGFGFVEVNSAEVAAAVIKKLQGSMLDHHKLSLQLSKRKPTAERAQAQAGAGVVAAPAVATGGKLPKGATTKLVVRNVAFETTRKDIAGMFAPFGHLKSCRLPKKFDGSHRGFAFVEFVTKQEAHNALEGVSGTHLLGRRLVVEYAKEEGGLDELRAKTAAKYKGDEEVLGEAPPSKKLKRSIGVV